MVFLIEHQTYLCDLEDLTKPLKDIYKFSSNSADKLDPNLPLVKSKAYGGTMVLWKSSLDAFISVHQVSSSSFLPIFFHPPGTCLTIHFAVYLPT